MIVNNNNDIQIKTPDGWIISVRFTPWSDKVDVWIANERDGLKRDLYHFNENGEMIAEGLKESVLDPKPTMTINRRIWEGIQRAFQGIEETPDKQAVDAELKATKYHLEDMRTLVISQKQQKAK